MFHSTIVGIQQCLEKMFPDATPEVDYMVRDEGDGQKIWWWGMRRPQPTDLELYTAAVPLAQAYKEREIRDTGADKLNALASPYRPEERDTWPIQRYEARAWLKDNTAPTPMLSQIAANRGVPLDMLISLVMENVTLFEAASGQLLGVQQNFLYKIYTVDTSNPEAALRTLEAIQWE